MKKEYKEPIIEIVTMETEEILAEGTSGSFGNKLAGFIDDNEFFNNEKN